MASSKLVMGADQAHVQRPLSVSVHTLLNGVYFDKLIQAPLSCCKTTEPVGCLSSPRGTGETGGALGVGLVQRLQLLALPWLALLETSRIDHCHGIRSLLVVTLGAF